MTKKKILLIEDDEFIGEVTKELLEIEGYAVDWATNGDEAIRVLSGDGALPGLILLDVAMPVKNGFEFREEQARVARFADIPVIVMTADGNAEGKTRKMGAKGYLKKPFDADQVVEVVGRHCA